MRKGTIIAVAISVLIILALMGLGVYLMIDLRTSQSTASISQETEFTNSETESADIKNKENSGTVPEIDALPMDGDSPENKSSDGSSYEGKLDEQTAAALRAAQAANAPLPEHRLIFVGDSRTVGMGEAEGKLGDTCIYIGEVGEGYYWFTDSGLPQMENAIAQYPDSPVIINLGVNDPDQISRYLELYSTFSDSYPTTSFYFMSVNPVTENSAHINNEEIAEFNTQLKAAFPDQYLDSYTYLQMQEFSSPDGVHYSKDTYRMIHDFAVKQVGK